MKQGEIYLVELDPAVGLEVGGEQWVGVVSNDVINASSFPVVVVPAIDAARLAPMRVTGVSVPAAESGLTADVVVDCISIRALDRSRFPAVLAGSLPPANESR